MMDKRQAEINAVVKFNTRSGCEWQWPASAECWKNGPKKISSDTVKLVNLTGNQSAQLSGYLNKHKQEIISIKAEYLNLILLLIPFATLKDTRKSTASQSQEGSNLGSNLRLNHSVNLFNCRAI